MRAKAWEVYFRSFDLEVPTVLLATYEQKPVADKVAMLLQHCCDLGQVFVVRNDKAPEPS